MFRFRINSIYYRYFFDSPAVTIIGEPSRDLAKQAGQEYDALLKDIKAHLGEQGLAAKAEQILKAEKENNQEIPSSVYDDVPPIDASKVDWIQVQSASSDSIKKTKASAGDNLLSHLKMEQVDLPYLVHYAHVSSNFITIRAMMNTSKIAPLLRP
jgi:Zn-dependent M16 (insulinase) family peptidase